MVSRRLESAGYEVVSAANGHAVIEMAEKEQPDVIILAIGMSDGDGHTVAHCLKRNLKTLTIPIIYLTARTSHENMQMTTDLGAAGYLLKPFKPERLLSLVERVLEDCACGESWNEAG